MIAADRDWLRRSFEKVYESFKGSVDAPGRPLGVLFMEKLFQLSVNVPPMRSQVRDSYWQYLTDENVAITPRPDDLLAEDLKQIEHLSPEEINSKREEWNSDSQEDVARRYALARRMASKDADRVTEVFLQQFVGLVEPNPRSMKRLVNAFGVQQQIMTVFGDPQSRASDGQVALWTIFSQRWPALADVVIRRPELVSSIGNTSARDEFPLELQPLVLDNSATSAVVRGDGVDFELNEQAIRSIAGLRANWRGASLTAGFLRAKIKLTCEV